MINRCGMDVSKTPCYITLMPEGSHGERFKWINLGATCTLRRNSNTFAGKVNQPQDDLSWPCD
jgi:hypothetical protein